MNNRLKAGLTFGGVMSVFFIAQELITAEHHGARDILKSIVQGLVAGAISGTIYGWLIGKFTSSGIIDGQTKIELEPDETLTMETLANHFKGVEAVGGKLFLTNKRLLFKSHKINIQNHEWSLPVEDITSVKRAKTMGLVNNGLLVGSAGGSERFVLNNAADWLKLLQSITADADPVRTA